MRRWETSEKGHKIKRISKKNKRLSSDCSHHSEDVHRDGGGAEEAKESTYITQGQLHKQQQQQQHAAQEYSAGTRRKNTASSAANKQQQQPHSLHYTWMKINRQHDITFWYLFIIAINNLGVCGLLSRQPLCVKRAHIYEGEGIWSWVNVCSRTLQPGLYTGERYGGKGIKRFIRYIQ